MDPLLFCPVKDCEDEPAKVLDLRAYLGTQPWPETLVCETHYMAIVRKPKAWKFTSSWETGLVISKK